MKIHLFAFLLLAGSSAAQTNDKVIEYAAIDSNVAYSAIGALPFRAPDEQIRYGDDPLQYGALWLPLGAENSPRKIIVLVHGGCWLNAYDIKHSYALSTALAQAGYLVWSLEYRRIGDAGGGWPGTFEDILAGIKYGANLPEHAFTLPNVVVVGHSAGGHLALLAGSRLPELKGVVGLAAITDVLSYSQGQNSCQQATPQFMGGTALDKPREYQSANPINMPLHVKTVLMQGNEDNIVPPSQAFALKATLVLNPLAGHFDWIHPGTSAYQQLLTQLDDMFKQ